MQNFYTDEMAVAYDEIVGDQGNLPALIDCLKSLASGGPALELGVGTGRIALPLARAGVKVVGIDASQAMINRLREKMAGDEIDVVVGDFSEMPVDGIFSLIFAASNTFFALLQQKRQVDCFVNAASKLRPGGRFVLETFVPSTATLSTQAMLIALNAGLGRVEFGISRCAPGSQILNSMHITLTDDGMRCLRESIRFAWPSELDLMGKIAGLNLEARWSDWTGSPVSECSEQVISVWTLADSAI